MHRNTHYLNSCLRAAAPALALLLLIAVTAGLTLLTHRTLLGREPGITMLLMLMAMKTLELRARRDAFVVFFLGFFLVLTQFLYSQSLLTALGSLLSLWGLLAAVVFRAWNDYQRKLRDKHKSRHEP